MLLRKKEHERKKKKEKRKKKKEKRKKEKKSAGGTNDGEWKVRCVCSGQADDEGFRIFIFGILLLLLLVYGLPLATYMSPFPPARHD